jgi:LysR family glycine cleavage system transcriptional activator
MNRRLPPLNGLRAFEAAARLLSFSKAAEELHVTPAAISHQIKGLEGYLGVPLFRRLNKALMLTEAGQAALPGLREGFDQLVRAVDAVRAWDVRRPLTVSTAPSFGAKWLVPRLERFRQGHPGTEVRVDATSELVDFAREEVDLAIRYGSGRYPGLAAERLLVEEVFPVCSPRLLEGPHPLRVPEDLRWHTLLHVDWVQQPDLWPDWSTWLRAAGVEGVDPTRGPRFSMSAMAAQAAIDGHGVALGSSVLLRDDLEAGRLVKPFELGFPVDLAYYLVYPEAHAERPKVVAFRRWLLAEVGSEAAH